MIEEDTVKLLRECNSGIKMGISSLEEVLPKVRDSRLRGKLERSRRAHGELGDDTHALLNRYGDDGKDPHPMAEAMSWVKTESRLAVDPTDHAVADVITDGCNMGVKSLSRYLNQYAAADEQSKAITRKLIDLESQLSHDLRDHL